LNWRTTATGFLLLIWPQLTIDFLKIIHIYRRPQPITVNGIGEVRWYFLGLLQFVGSCASIFIVIFFGKPFCCSPNWSFQKRMLLFVTCCWVNLVILRLIDALIPSVTSADRILMQRMKWQQHELRNMYMAHERGRLATDSSDKRYLSRSNSDLDEQKLFGLMNAEELVDGHCFYEADIGTETKMSAAREADVNSALVSPLLA